MLIRLSPEIPTAVRLEGGSVGLQIGAESMHLIMLDMSQHGMDQRPLHNREVLTSNMAPPGAAGPSIEALTKYSPRETKQTNEMEVL